MADPVECRIVVEKRKDGRKEVLLHDPHNLRTATPGVATSPAETEKVVRKLKERCEREGMHVTVKEI